MFRQYLAHQQNSHFFTYYFSLPPTLRILVHLLVAFVFRALLGFTCIGLLPQYVALCKDCLSFDCYASISRTLRILFHFIPTLVSHARSGFSKYVLFNRCIFVHLQLVLYDSTMIAPFPLLFFGGEISVFVEEGYETVAIDDFIKFKSPNRIANLVKVSFILPKVIRFLTTW